MKRRMLGALLVGALAVQLAPHAGARELDANTTRPAPAAFDSTDPLEANRVDRVDVSTFTLPPCPDQTPEDAEHFGKLDCGQITVPRDYDEPAGELMHIDVMRRQASDPTRKRGAIFINPGGPGGSALRLLTSLRGQVPDVLLEEYDMIAVEPRGMVGRGETPRCFETKGKQQTATNFIWNHPYPTNLVDSLHYVDQAKMLGVACAARSSKILTSMSTAEVVRDHEVVRRALGLPEFNFLGFSYGSYIGQVYANVFPDRVGRIAIDGVVDGEHWSGEPGIGEILQDSRLRSGQGAERALQELLKRCDEAGPGRCAAAPGAGEKYRAIESELRREPFFIPHPYDWQERILLEREQFSAYLLNSLFSSMSGESLMQYIQDVHTAMNSQPPVAVRQSAGERILRAHREAHTELTENIAALAPPQIDMYDDSLEKVLGVVCSDAKHPTQVMSAMAQARAVDRPGVSLLQQWAWQSVPCSPDIWTTQDEDAYFGPFDRKSRKPLLIIGNEWDPATNIDDARRTAARQPNSLLVTSNNWGHTAINRSDCVDSAVVRYFADGSGEPTTTCTDGWQPFTDTGYTDTSERLRALPLSTHVTLAGLTLTTSPVADTNGGAR